MYYKIQFIKQTHSSSTFFRPSNLLSAVRQVSNRKLWHSCTCFRSYCATIPIWILIWHDNNCIKLLSIIQIQKSSIPWYCRKKKHLLGLLAMPKFFFISASRITSFQNICILHNDSDTPNLLWVGIKRHPSCLMWKILMWNHLFPFTFNYETF